MRELVVEVLLDALDLGFLDLARALVLLDAVAVKTCTSMTVPSMPGGHAQRAVLTSEAFSPKMARSSFSSGVSWLSPFGVTLPTMMSPARTSAPMYTTPTRRGGQGPSRTRSGCRR